jgi:hypothetical protein
VPSSELQFCKMKRVLETDGGDSYTTMQSNPQNCSLKNGSDYLVCIYHNKKIINRKA